MPNDIAVRVLGPGDASALDRVADAYQGRGIGGRVLRALLDHGGALGCAQAWVLTSPGNAAAVRLYAAASGRRAEEPTVLYAFELAPEGSR